MSADRYEHTNVPEWVSEYGGEFDLPEWVWRTGHAQKACESNLPPVVVWRELLYYSGLKYGTRSMGLWISTYVGGKHKLAQRGRVQGNRLHCYPKAEDFAQRSGASERTVREHLLSLEHAGWLHIERHRQAPSDYWIAIPDCDLCPCGCEDTSPPPACDCGNRDDGGRCFMDCYPRPEETAARPEESSGLTGKNVRTGPEESADALGPSTRTKHLNHHQARCDSPDGSITAPLDVEEHQAMEERISRFIARFRESGIEEERIPEFVQQHRENSRKQGAA